MNIEELIIVRRKVQSIITDCSYREGDTKELKRLVEDSQDIFCKLYKGKDIATKDQVLLYNDDILFLDNDPDFRKNYIVINDISSENGGPYCFGRVFPKQYGQVLVISMDMANKLLKQASLESFKK